MNLTERYPAWLHYLVGVAATAVANLLAEAGMKGDAKELAQLFTPVFIFALATWRTHRKVTPVGKPTS